MNGAVVIKKLTDIASSSSLTLKRLWSPIWRVLSLSPADDAVYPSKNLSVCIEKGRYSVAYGRRFLSRIKIKGFREYSFEEDKYPNPDVVASSLTLAVNDLGAAKADVSLGIPKTWAVIKTVEFPATVRENLSSAVAYELDRVTPFSSDDALYDFRIIEETESKLSLLITAVKAERIMPYIEALKENGINVNTVTVNLSGLETLCRYKDKDANNVFVEIGKNEYSGALFLNYSIIGSFSKNFSTSDEKSRLDAIKTDTAPLIDAAKKQGKSPHLIVYFSDKNPSLREMIKMQSDIPVKILNESDINLSLPGHVNDIPYTALGIVLESLWTRANRLNLLRKGFYESPKTPKAFTIILLSAIMGLWVLSVIAPLKVEEKRLAELDRQIMLRKDEVKKVEALEKEIEKLSQDIAMINDFKSNNPMALSILRELTSILPHSTWLTRMRISETAVNIEGYASSATGLLPKLEASSYFKKAEFASPTFRDTRMNADRFNIKMEIEAIKKENMKKSAEKDEEEENEEE